MDFHEPTEAPAEDDATVTQLAAARARRDPRPPTARATKTRRTTKRAPGPARPRTTRKAAPGPGAQLASLVSLGANLMAPAKPLHAAILIRQAATLGPIIDRVASEDPNVAAWIGRLSGVLGRGGAWGELAAWGAQTGAAMLVVTGGTPTGMLGLAVAAIAGGLVDAALTDAAQTIAAQYGVDPDEVRGQLVNELAARNTPHAPAEEDAQAAS